MDVFTVKTIEKSLLVGFVLSLILSMTSFANGCDSLRTKVLRLHIQANSNSEQDQALKLKVRDKIIEKSGSFLDGVSDKELAQRLTEENLENIKRIAEEEVAAQGFSYPVHVEVTDMYFPTRQYENVTLPAGRYDALRVLIGDGKGKNWWCVIFPQMCLGCAMSPSATDTLLTDNEKVIISSSEKFEVKFKVVEWYYGLKTMISGWFDRV